ncbi:MAG TPA: N-acetylneuraminate synthase family protein [Roseivirga sp.]
MDKVSSETYLIAEIGQNHNGSVELAKALIDLAHQPVEDELFNRKLAPWNAVKFTKRDLEHELSTSAMLKPYDNPHSYGKTYGEHRAKLELSDEEHYELFLYAKGKGLDFVETLCAVGCLTLLKYFIPDKLKVASRDLTNLPLLSAMAETKIPIIVSTGMGGIPEIDSAVQTISKYHSDITILHCLSEYPSDYKHINLRSLNYLKERYKGYNIGYSDHSIGIAMPLAAVAMGARMIEKHVTLDRSMKGTDHAGSLAPDGMRRMVRDIRNLELAFGEPKKEISEAVLNAKNKLERSIATKRDLKMGEVINENDLQLLSPGDGIQWSQRNSIIGKRLKNDIAKNEIIYPQMLAE